MSAGSELTYAAALGYRFQRHTSPIEIGGELNGGLDLTQAKGYGESQPLEKGGSAGAMTENRRVEFVIVDSTEGE